MSDGEAALVGFRPCGCWKGFVMEREPRARQMTASFLKDGGTVRSMSISEARAVKKRCDAHPRGAERQGVLL